jgi:glutathione S-transferase
MALTFYYGSGSPYAWKVWLALEHKGIPYEFRLLSFDADDTRKPQFLALNPRGRVPTIVDDGYALWESSAIVEYLEERHPQKPLLPGDAKIRAAARRITAEVDAYLAPANGRLFELTLFRQGEADAGKIAEAQKKVMEELALFETQVKGPHILGPLSLADFTLYPYVRLLKRLEERQPGNGVADSRLPPKIAAWKKQIEALPYYEKTLPPHWKG